MGDMEVEQVVSAAGKKAILKLERMNSDRDRVRVKRKTLEAVLGECQRALQLLSTTGCLEEVGDDSTEDDDESDDNAAAGSPSSTPCRDQETAELCDLIKSRVECADFLEKLETAQASVFQSIAEESTSWDMVNENDLWEGGKDLDQDDYVLVRQEDIVDGIACFMAAYLLSLKETKELTPNQLQQGQLNCFYSLCLFPVFLLVVGRLVSYGHSMTMVDKLDLLYNFTI
ncbi:OLC1v1017256C5 [Oldenlandia corymbosa var. corymbosa]|uniref:OLC1v1017256C5 n=1 Tax=Oldenlandia corymbosa var. corymbosa TaxID=529605 RepID=A0AAV1E969_OLDCO|nr:OLC1v1017256C5 [Oldenlandia corymbosa var. corymbosa]